MEKNDSVQRRKGVAGTMLSKIRIHLPKDVTADSEEQCRKSLVVKVITDKFIGYGSLLNTFNKILKCKEKFDVVALGTNFYHVLFKSELDEDRVLLGCPWYFDSQILIIKKWKPWDRAGNHICKYLGNVLKSEVILGGAKYGKFLRCLVELDLTQPLIPSMIVEQDGLKVEAVLKYENVSLFCAYCGIIGHKSANCDAKVMDQREGIYREELYGPELTAVPLSSIKNHSAPAAAPQQAFKKDLPTANEKKSQEQHDEGKKHRSFQEQGTKSEVIISKGQNSFTGKGKEPLVEEKAEERWVEEMVLEPIIEEPYSEQVVTKEEGMWHSVGEVTGENNQHSLTQTIVIEEYVSPARSPETLMIEWYSASHEVVDEAAPSSEVAEIVNSEEDLENLRDFRMEMADQIRKRKLDASKKIQFRYPQDTDFGTKAYIESCKENEIDVLSAEIMEPFEKKLKIDSTPEQEERVEAASPKWLPHSK